MDPEKLDLCHWQALITINPDLTKILQEFTGMWFQHLVDMSPSDGSGGPGQVGPINWLKLLELTHYYSMNTLSLMGL